MRKWLAVTLLSMVLVTGCMGGGGGGGSQPQSAPEPSSDETQKAVTKALHDPEMKDFLRTAVRSQSGAEMLELALDTQDGQTLIHDAVKRSLNSATGQQAIISQVGQMMNDPSFRLQMQQHVRDVLMEMMAKGAEGKAKGSQKSGGASGKSGGQQSGGGGGGESGGGGG